MQSLEVSDRTRLRMERLRVAELEQQRSEEEAVAVLVHIQFEFKSVKTEFYDLDGLSHDERTPRITSDATWACAELDSDTASSSRAPCTRPAPSCPRLSI